MRLSKFLTIVTALTLFSLLYVYQQTEIVRLAYVGQKKVSQFQDLLDKNNILRYNIGKRVSLVEVGGRIAGGTDFQMPDSYRLVRMAPVKKTSKLTAGVAKRETLAFRIFGIKREAEAETLNP